MKHMKIVVLWNVVIFALLWLKGMSYTYCGGISTYLYDQKS